MKAHPICAGDLVRAIDALAPVDEDARKAIAGMLGYELRAAGAPPPRPFEKAVVPEEEPAGRAAKRTGADAVEREPARAAAPRARNFQLRAYKAGEGAVPSHLIAPQTSPALPPGGREDLLPLPPYEPLFNPQWSRAVLSTMARIRTRTGPPDLEDLVAIAAERKPMFSLPASLEETASGADVLLDVGESMAVFGRDQERLLDLMRRVLGGGQISVFRFNGSPERGVRGRSFKPHRYKTPRPGWPVVLLTDLGIGSTSSGAGATGVEEWRRFAHSVHAGGCHLIALVPYPAARWPAKLTPAMNIIQWDRVTSVRTVRAIIGRRRGGA